MIQLSNDYHECHRWRTWRRKVDCIAAYYAHERACLGCEDGKKLAKEIDLRILPAKPKVVNKPKKTKPKPPIRVPVPIWEKPLCKKCGRWAAVALGMCRSCYQKRRRDGAKRTENSGNS